MKPTWIKNGITILTGDCRQTLKTLPEKSVHCCVTSPPYFGLRDYGHDGQIGLEETPDKYVSEMVAVFREVWRVLRDDGTLWLNLGDSYAANRAYQVPDGKWTDVGNSKGMNAAALGLKPKDLIGIPWRVAFALQADGWYLRQDLIWHKPNPMPESVTDRCTKSHEYIFLLTKSERYFYDSEAIRESATTEKGKGAIGRGAQGSALAVGCNGRQPQQDHSGWMGGDGETRNKRSVWTVSTKPYGGAHFAVFPPDLIEPCVLAGCPEGGTVLDPFNGSGTTGEVARKCGCLYIGCELNPDYVTLTKQRLQQGNLFVT